MVALLDRKLLEVLAALKNMPRTGWVQRGVPPAIAETVASHLLEASVLCLEIGVELASIGFMRSEDVYRAAAIALVHDVGEGLVGDLNKLVSREIGDLKDEIEEKAVRSIGSGEILSLYREYKEGSTLPSRLARICDKLSTYIQARRYAALGYGVEEIAETSLEEIRSMARDMCRDNHGCGKIIDSYIGKSL